MTEKTLPPSATYREAFTHEEALAFAELWKDTPTHSPNPGGLFGKLARYILASVPSETRPIYTVEQLESWQQSFENLRREFHRQGNHDGQRGCEFALESIRLYQTGTPVSATPRSGEFINMPDTLHKDTRYLVILFAEAMAYKLNKAQEKYGYDNGWARNDWEAECLERLHEHLAKGDPRDVANYCAFMWHHGWSTKAVPPARPEKLYSADGRGG